VEDSRDEEFVLFGAVEDDVAAMFPASEAAAE
jgi:hypothetical protein